MNAEERREYNRVKQAESRAKKKASLTVNDNQQCQHIQKQSTEAEASKKSGAKAPLCPTKSDGSEKFLLALWKSAPLWARTRSSKKQVADEWKKATRKPDHAEVLNSIEAWKQCAEWTRDGGQAIPGLHRWIKNRQWENTPGGFKPKSPPWIGPDGFEAWVENTQWGCVAPAVAWATTKCREAWEASKP